MERERGIKKLKEGKNEEEWEREKGEGEILKGDERE